MSLEFVLSYANERFLCGDLCSRTIQHISCYRKAALLRDLLKIVRDKPGQCTVGIAGMVVESGDLGSNWKDAEGNITQRPPCFIIQSSCWFGK